MKFYAHSGELSDRSDWQLLPDHLDSTARLAAERGERLGLAAAAALAGRYHDFGKYDRAFDRVLSGGNDRVDHSTAGAALLHARTSGAMRLVADVISRGGVDRNSTLTQPCGSMRVSPPSRGRGSKLRPERRMTLRLLVAPFAGAWIETSAAPFLER